MHIHGFARAERVRPNLFWGKSKSSHAHPTGLGPGDCDDLRGANGADPLADVRIFSDWGGGRAPVLLYVEENVKARLEQAGSQII